MDDVEQRAPHRAPPGPELSEGRRWTARLALLVVVAALATPLLFAGLRSVVLLSFGAVGLVAVAVGGWWALSRRGAVRVAGVALATLALAAVVAVFQVVHF